MIAQRVSAECSKHCRQVETLDWSNIHHTNVTASNQIPERPIPAVAKRREDGLIVVIKAEASEVGGSGVHYDEALTYAGTSRISFEGQPPGTSYGVSQYVESDIQFTGQPDLAHTGAGLNGRADDGTGYLSTAYKMVFLDLRGRLFTLKAVDLAEYSYIYAYPFSITFVGSKVNGATVSQTFTTDGQLGVPGIPDFQTFTFGEEWNDLVRIDVQGDVGFCIDNVVLER